MVGEIVHTLTKDHLRLHGFYSASRSSVRTNRALGHCDAAVLLHGLGGNFYSSRLLSHFSQTLQRFGVSTVLANTRGHDMINVASWGGRSQNVGAAFESVSHSTFDIPAWVEFLISRGHSSVLLFGHSLGAIKSLYAQANQPHERVSGIVALSATRLSYHKLIDSPRGDVFRQTIQRCTDLIEAGQADDPIQVPFPFPTWMTPSGYLQKYGPQETYNWINFIGQVEPPTLMIFGQRELDNHPAFEGLRGEFAGLAELRNLQVREIPDADHFYASQLALVDEQLEQWLT